MDFQKIRGKGNDFCNQLFDFLDGDYSYFSRVAVVSTHVIMMNKGGWEAYYAFNDATVQEFAEMLDVPIPDEEAIMAAQERNDRFKGKINVKLVVDDETKNLDFDDYTELINFAESIGDIEWRNELLERECK